MIYKYVIFFLVSYCSNSFTTIPDNSTFSAFVAPSGAAAGLAANLTCGANEYECENGNCIDHTWACDHNNDCGDYSDEKNCSYTCDKNYFTCNNKKCVRTLWRCDGENDCGDHSDETYCPNSTCDPFGEMQCDNGRCIQKNWQCDHEIDCSNDGTDDSDERGCDYTNITCGPNEFLCKNASKCIQERWRCDHDDDCGDKSDEMNCTRTSICEGNDFACRNGNCIEPRWQCDREDDCGDNSDEDPVTCPRASCKTNYFTCNNGYCIRQSWVCDGENDCRDNSDEIAPVCTTKNIETCPSNYFRCKSGAYGGFGKCIRSSWCCDGTRDCLDGTDEEGCPAIPECKEFLCQSGQCLSMKSKCNGIFECRDGDDEIGCDFKCKKGYFRCGYSYQCINESKVCDEKFDCRNHGDEPWNCGRNECKQNNKPCAHICEDLVIGYKCHCHEGYELEEDGRHCQDINECSILGKCSQLCLNTKGGYKCSCLPGYQLEEKGHCRALGEGMYILFSDQKSIRKLEVLRSLQYHAVVSDLQSVVGISYFAMAGYIYWSDAKEQQISRLQLNEPTKVEIIAQDIKLPNGLAVDWMGLKLYWVDAGRRLIEVAEMNGNHRSKLVSSGLDSPRSIAVDPRDENRFIYWSDWGLDAKIERISMDGDPLTRQLIHSRRDSWPNGLVVDFTINRLFWIDAKRETMESSSLNGSDHKEILTLLGQHPFSVSIFEDYAYWTDWKTESVHRANKFTGESIALLQGGLYKPMGISVYHPLLQPGASNPCVRSYCSHLCLLSHLHGYKCACPTGFDLLEDQQTCNTSDAYSCKPGHCKRGGTCFSYVNGKKVLPKCHCPRGYGGPRCDHSAEILIPIYQNGHIVKYLCVDDYCLNGGTCQDSSGYRLRPMCKCLRGFYGSRCQFYYGHLLKKVETQSSKSLQKKVASKIKRLGETIGISVGASLSILCIAVAAIGFLVYRNQSGYRPSLNLTFANLIYKATTTSDYPDNEQDLEEETEEDCMLTSL